MREQQAPVKKAERSKSISSCMDPPLRAREIVVSDGRSRLHTCIRPVVETGSWPRWNPRSSSQLGKRRTVATEESGLLKSRSYRFAIVVIFALADKSLRPRGNPPAGKAWPIPFWRSCSPLPPPLDSCPASPQAFGSTGSLGPAYLRRVAPRFLPHVLEGFASMGSLAYSFPRAGSFHRLNAALVPAQSMRQDDGRS